MNKKRGEIILKILESLKEGALCQADFIMAVLSLPYGVSIGRLNYETNRRSQKREDKNYESSKHKDNRKRLQKYFSKLRNDGLIDEDKNRTGYIVLSKKGLDKLKRLVKKKGYYQNLKKTKSPNLIIVSYDIPEFFKKQRNLVRDILKFLGFNMVHKSLWIGKTKIPKEFLVTLGELEVLKYIEFLEVTRAGSLKPVDIV